MARMPMRDDEMTVGMGMGAEMPMPSSESPMPMDKSAMPGMAAGMGAETEVPEEPEEEESNVSPEEQALYHKFMENYYSIMYIGQPDKNIEPLADSVRQEYFSGDMEPIEALANAGFSTVDSLAKSAEKAGKSIPGDVLMHAGVEVIEDLGELAEKAGFHDFSEEELDGSLFRAMDLYREMNQGSLDQDAIKSDYESMVQADKEGKIEEFLPGISEAEKRYASQEPEAEPPVAGPAPPTRGMGA